jgi:aspartate-semialdehyde dehydrogenase
MATPLETRRIVIAGASSLLGADLKTLLEESRFAASDFRLVDEETVAGILTEAGGEAAVIQPVEEDSFNKAWLVFFTGSAAFTKTNLALAQRSGARIVDLSGALADDVDSPIWLPNWDRLTGASFDNAAGSFCIPSAPAEIISRLAIVLHTFAPKTVSAVAFQPVSSIGKSGIEELESQTSHLLSFQTIGSPVFDTQVAFSMLDRYGPASVKNLHSALQGLRNEVRSCLLQRFPLPAVQLLHAPVFYGSTVTVCATLDPLFDLSAITKACAEAGFILTSDDSAPTNISVAGESAIQLAPPQAEESKSGGCWFWAAADNLRLPASNAVKLAEKLLE